MSSKPDSLLTRMHKWINSIEEVLVQPEPIYMTRFLTNNWIILCHQSINMIQLDALLDAIVQTENLKSIFHRYTYESVFPLFLLKTVIDDFVPQALIGFFVFNFALVTTFLTMHIVCKRNDLMKFAAMPGQIMLAVIFFEISLVRYPLVWWVSHVLLNSSACSMSVLPIIFGLLSLAMMIVLIWTLNLFTIDTIFEQTDFDMYVVGLYYIRKMGFSKNQYFGDLRLPSFKGYLWHIHKAH